MTDLDGKWAAISWALMSLSQEREAMIEAAAQEALRITRLSPAEAEAEREGLEDHAHWVARLMIGAALAVREEPPGDWAFFVCAHDHRFAVAPDSDLGRVKCAICGTVTIQRRAAAREAKEPTVDTERPDGVAKDAGNWEGVNGGDPWRLEVEVDCMTESEPFTVSVWVGDAAGQTKGDVEGAFLSSEQAREVAAVLVGAAEGVDRNNTRVEVQERVRDAEQGHER